MNFSKRGDFQHIIEIALWIVFIAIAIFGIGFLFRRLGIF